MSAHRCGACGGIWLDPANFRALCDAEARPRSSSALARRDRAGADRPSSAGPIRYLPCPVCDETMNRVNFARVSGVILDVCRPHGAWFEAGELQELRRFVSGPGIFRYLWRRSRDRGRDRPSSTRAPRGPGHGPGVGGFDLLDILAGLPDPWGVPKPRSSASAFLRAIVLGVAGGMLLWIGLRGGDLAALAGGIALLAAFRALADAIERHGAKHEKARRDS